MAEHRPVFTVDLLRLSQPSPVRPNVHTPREKRRHEMTVADVVGAGLLGLIGSVIAILLMTGKG